MREQSQQPASAVDTINPAETDGLLTAEEVASLLQVTPAWVYAETRRRRIPHIRLGRYVRYRRFALQAWMDDMERSSTGRQSSRPR
jgi:excisionase family DNA binding protein